jgi:Protein of unknown function (DUF4254)
MSSRSDGLGPAADVAWVSDVVSAFRCVVDQPDGALPGAHAGALLSRLVELHRTNLAQWALEDAVRAPRAGDGTVAAAKREIDTLNARRHHLVEDVDAAISEAMVQTPSAPPSTESPGMVLDRLSVLVIRLHHTELAVRSARPDTRISSSRLADLHGQLAVLVEALGVLLQDVREGRRQFLPYRSLKLYGS